MNIYSNQFSCFKNIQMSKRRMILIILFLLLYINFMFILKFIKLKFLNTFKMFIFNLEIILINSNFIDCY